MQASACQGQQIVKCTDSRVQYSWTMFQLSPIVALGQLSIGSNRKTREWPIAVNRFTGIDFDFFFHQWSLCFSKNFETYNRDLFIFFCFHLKNKKKAVSFEWILFVLTQKDSLERNNLQKKFEWNCAVTFVINLNYFLLINLKQFFLEIYGILFLNVFSAWFRITFALFIFFRGFFTPLLFDSAVFTAFLHYFANFSLFFQSIPLFTLFSCQFPFSLYFYVIAQALFHFYDILRILF